MTKLQNAHIRTEQLSRYGRGEKQHSGARDSRQYDEYLVMHDGIGYFYSADCFANIEAFKNAVASAFCEALDFDGSEEKVLDLCTDKNPVIDIF